MNGRIYDPELGRMISADPTIPHPHNPQSYNRYSYVMNNPLSRTDPTGFTDEQNQYLKDYLFTFGGTSDDLNPSLTYFATSGLLDYPLTSDELITATWGSGFENMDWGLYLFPNGFDEEQDARGRRVVDTTAGAVNHYLDGQGEPVVLGPNTITFLLTSEEHLYRSDRIRSGVTAGLSGNYSVNLRGEDADVYHVGRTTIQYRTVCTVLSCSTIYVGFTRNLPEGGYGPDGFWDIFWGNDTVGPQGELFGTPYPYTTYQWIETFPNPYLSD